MFSQDKIIIIITMMSILFLTMGCIEEKPTDVYIDNDTVEYTHAIPNMGGTKYEGSDGYNYYFKDNGTYNVYIATTNHDMSYVNSNLYYTPKPKVIQDRFGGHLSYEREVARDLGVTDQYSVINQTITITNDNNNNTLGVKCYNEHFCNVHIVISKVS